MPCGNRARRARRARLTRVPGHCKRLAPTWDELAGAVPDSTVIGYVDCTVHEALCSKYSVTGYPTLKVFNEETGLTGKSYEGSRDLSELKKYVDENLSKKCDVNTPNDGGCNAKARFRARARAWC